MADRESSDEEASLLHKGGTDHSHFLVYKRRWWILFVFCFCSVTQSTLWNTWSPILDSMQIAYDWTDSFTALLLGSADVGYMVMTFPLMFLVENKGIIQIDYYYFI